MMYRADLTTASGSTYTAYAATPYDALCALLEDGHDWRQINIRPAKQGERMRRQEAAHDND